MSSSPETLTNSFDQPSSAEGCPYKSEPASFVDDGSTLPPPDPAAPLDSPPEDLEGSEDEHSTPRPDTCPVIWTQEIDPELLRTSLDARISYLTDFLGFTSDDADIITEVAPLVNDMIPEMVDGMYETLFQFDICKKVFMTRNEVCS